MLDQSGKSRMKQDIISKVAMAFQGRAGSLRDPASSIILKPLALGEDQATGAQPSSLPVSYLINLAAAARGGADV